MNNGTLFDTETTGGEFPDDKPVTVFTTPATRNSDPITSAQAASSVRNVTRTHRRILSMFDGSAWTDEELLDAWRHTYTDQPISPSGLRSRRAELVKSGLIEDSGERDRTEANRATIVWRITDEGRRAL